MKRALLLCVMLALVLSTGCASIVSSSRYPVMINSSPSGATVIIKNKYGMGVQTVTTPATVILPASSGFFGRQRYLMSFEKEGYLPSATQLSAGLDAWYIGNLLFGGLLGMLIIDPATGAMWRLDGMVYGNLSPDRDAQRPPIALVPQPAAPPRPPDGAADIVKQLKALQGLHESGLLTDKEYETRRKALADKL